MFSFPDMSKITPMLEEALASFRTLVADVKEIKESQAEILRRLAEKEGE